MNIAMAAYTAVLSRAFIYITSIEETYSLLLWENFYVKPMIVIGKYESGENSHRKNRLPRLLYELNKFQSHSD